MQTMNDFEVRNLHFVFDDTIPRYWHRGSAGRTVYFNSQSLFFPTGERFFVDAVKPFISQLQDPVLRRNAQLFCGQEAIHQREHESYNRMLERQGYPVAKLERAAVWLLAFGKLFHPRIRLAVTCALEHFTAVGARAALTQPHLLSGADPRMATFWRWHAGEETEHKSVPYDVYYAVGGYWLERVLVMLSTALIYKLASFVFVAGFFWVDGQLVSPQVWRDLFDLLRPRDRRTAGLSTYLQYFRPGFHPSQLDSSAALAAFERELEAPGLQLAVHTRNDTQSEANGALDRRARSQSTIRGQERQCATYPTPD